MKYWLRSRTDPNLVSRVQKYLNENRNKRFIDIEAMVLTLHEAYPEYHLMKLRQFRIQVDSAFKSIRDTAAKVRARQDRGRLTSLCAGVVAFRLLAQGNLDKVDELPLPSKLAEQVKEMLREIKK